MRFNPAVSKGSFVRFLGAILLGSMLVSCGGVIQVGPGGGDSGDGDDGNGNGGGAPGDDEVVIVFVNESDADVDTQFYAAHEPLANASEDLFVPEFRIQAGIGVTGTGILQSGSDDEITLPCSEDTVLGTEGGEFRDPDLGTSLAQGQVRLVRVGENFDCGNRIIFAFTGDNGDYNSVPPIPDSRE